MRVELPFLAVKYRSAEMNVVTCILEVFVLGVLDYVTFAHYGLDEHVVELSGGEHLGC